MTRTTGGKAPRKPRPMGVTLKLEQGGRAAVVKARGPVHLVERDVRRHVVVSRWAKGSEATRGRTKSGRARRATIASRVASVEQGLGAGGGGRRAVLHWGNAYARYTFASSKGRHPWRSGVAEGQRQLAQINARELAQAIRRA